MCFLLRVIRLKKRFRLPRLTLCFQYRFRMVPTTQEPDKFHFVQLLSKMEKKKTGGEFKSDYVVMQYIPDQREL